MGCRCGWPGWPGLAQVDGHDSTGLSNFGGQISNGVLATGHATGGSCGVDHNRVFSRNVAPAGGSREVPSPLRPPVSSSSSTLSELGRHLEVRVCVSHRDLFSSQCTPSALQDTSVSLIGQPY